MKTMQTLKTIVLLTLSLLFAFSSCEQPFKAGLGPVADIRKPTISLLVPANNSSIWGPGVVFSGHAEDDYKLDRVEFRITNQPGKWPRVDTDDDGVDDDDAWLPAELNKSAQSRGTWSYTINSYNYPDGMLKVQVRVFDVVRGPTEGPTTLDEYLFYIRNELPVISLDGPQILRDQLELTGGEPKPNQKQGVILPFYEDLTRSAHLNYAAPGVAGYNPGYGYPGYPVDGPLPDVQVYPRQIEPKTSISGTISYDDGIYTGIETGPWYPPQYRLWRLENTPDHSKRIYKLGELPGNELPWVDFIQEGGNPELQMSGSGRYVFSRRMADDETGYFGFEMRALSEDGRVAFRYPRDNWPEITAPSGTTPDGELPGKGLSWEYPPSGPDGDFIKENRYVLFFVRSNAEPTSVKYWDREDLTGAWNSVTGSYPNDPAAVQNSDTPYYYVDANRVDRNGKFIVRINAQHTMGIRSAFLFWTSESNGKGVFVWDSTGLPNGAVVDTSKPFSNWGFNPLASGVPNPDKQKDFIFTYDPAVFTAANSRIWRYSGSDDWNTVKNTIKSAKVVGDNFVNDKSETIGGWTRATDTSGKNTYILGEDTYTFTVYALSETEMPGSPGTRSVRIDYTPPAVTLNDIEGAYYKDNDGNFIVNEVIRPSVRIDDGSGVGIRDTGNSYYGTSGGAEQRYILVNDASKAAMDTLIESQKDWRNTNNYWPPVTLTGPNTSGGSQTMSGVTVWRHGPVSGAKDFMFKTSELYSIAVGTALPGNTATPGVYWLYVFARDKAFNVQTMAPVKITVNADTNKPLITFGASVTTDVTNASKSADGTSTGFYAPPPAAGVPPTLRNRLLPSSTVPVTLTDDDSLDLGTSSGRPSSVQVTITGVQQDFAGEVSLLPGVVLSDTAVKSIFAPQPVTATGPLFRQKVNQRIPSRGIEQSVLATALSTSKDSTGSHNYDYLFFGYDYDGSPAPAEPTALPDGIYRITVRVDEDEGFKLEVSGESGTKNEEHEEKNIWVVVDTTAPVVTKARRIDVGVNNEEKFGDTAQWINLKPVTGSTPGLGIEIKGTIFERNGPVTLTGEITDDQGNQNPINIDGTSYDWDTLVKFDGVEITGSSPVAYDISGGITPFAGTRADFTAPFTAIVYIDDRVSANFRVTLTATDRFGRSSTHSSANPTRQIYKVDAVPPTVTLTPVPVFKRQDANITDSVGNVQYERLTNGIVKFEVSAADTLSKVEEIRYWLLPSDGTALAPGNSAFPAGGTNAQNAIAWAYTGGLTAGAATTTGGKHEAFLTTVTTKPTFYIDTTKLDDKKDYCLYVMAIDAAGNISAGGAGALKQTIFVNQEQDAPWFVSNTLVGTVRGSNTSPTIIINDDDGFNAAATGSAFRPGTIRVWLSTNPSIPAGSTDTDASHLSAYGYVGPYTVPTDAIPPKISTQNSADPNLKYINVNFNLTEGGSDFQTELDVDGRVHYIVEATDSWAGKFTSETGSPPTTATAPVPPDGTNAYTISRRIHYTFIRDSKPPLVVLDQAIHNQTFGRDDLGKAAGFVITGSISDAYLKRDGTPSSTGNYIIGINVGSKDLWVTTPPASSTLTPFKLSSTTAPIYDYVTGTALNQNALGATVTNDTRVNFTITNAAALDAVGYATLPEGRNTLLLKVEDQSGQMGSTADTNTSIAFIKDTTAPEYAFLRGFNDTKQPLPKINGGNWWTKIAAIGTPAWTSDPNNTKDYLEQRAKLPVVTHDGSSRPFISGTFTDALSNIDRHEFYIAWDNTGTFVKIPEAQLGIDGKTVSWTVYLTSGADGVAGTQAGTVLPDGVHSIQVRISDIVGNVYDDSLINPEPLMYGFRVVSESPKAALTHVNDVTPLQTGSPPSLVDNPLIQKVYGDRANFTDSTVFTLEGYGTSPNLSDVIVRIRYTDTNAYPAFERSVLAPDTVLIPGDINDALKLDWSFTATPASDRLEWKLNIHRAYIMKAGGIVLNNTNLMRPGNYEVRIIAVDSAGTQSEETENVNTWTFMVDSAAPTFNFNLPVVTDSTPARNPVDFTVNDPNRGPAYWLDYKTLRNVLGDTPVIAGRVSDVNELDSVQLQLARWNYNGGTGNTGEWVIYDFTSNAWVGSADGLTSWTTLAPTPPATAYSSEYSVNFDFSNVTGANARDTEGNLLNGYYSVRLRARDVSKFSGGTTGWGTGVGNTDQGNPAASHYVYFFIDTKTPVLSTPNTEATTYSSRYLTASDNGIPYGLQFNITAEDLNMFEEMKLSVERVNPLVGGDLPAPVTVSAPKRDGTGAWTASAVIPFVPQRVVPASGSRPATGNASTGLPDGTYRIVFTAVDLAGKTGRESRNITLDNSAPTGSVSEPRFQGLVTTGNAINRFASEVKIGGETLEITGTADDSGDNGSASGPKEIWYRIGYGSKDVASLQALLDGTEDAAARSAKIAAWVVNSGDGLGLGTGTYDKGAASNDLFEAAAKAKNGSLWFKYAETAVPYDVPQGFEAITAAAAADPYSWSMASTTLGANSVATSYAVSTLLTMRGTNYTRDVTAGQINGVKSAADQWLARVIPSSTYYSLPLVIRVVDNAGNAFYELRDIWLHPNGDNPRSNFTNPVDRYTPRTSPKGGQFSVDGVALDNISVNTVIYRVKVDNTQSTAASNAPVDRTISATSPAGNISNDIQTNTRYFTAAGHGLIVGDTVVVGGNPRYVLWVNGSNFKLSNTYTWPTDNVVWNPATGNQTITATNIVTIPGAERWTAHAEYENMRTVWNGKSVTSGGESDSAMVLSQHGWYMANLESTPYDSTMPWSVTLNAGGEITELITAGKGFAYGGSNMIRVWVEVLVFDGSSAAGGVYNLMSLGNSTNADNPRPYVSEFFVTASAPSVDNRFISPLGSTTPSVSYGVAPTAPVASNYVRSGSFALQARLNSAGANIDEISVRLRGEPDDSGWRPVYKRGVTTTLPNGVSALNWTSTDRIAVLTYTFNSLATASTTGVQAVRNGAWKQSGGTFTVDVRVKDVSTAEANYTFEVGIDNFIPIADTAKNITPMKVAGSNVPFFGRVFDYQGLPGADPSDPPHRKIKEVHVWFTNRADTEYINMSTGTGVAKTSASVAKTNRSVWKPTSTINWDTVNPNNVSDITGVVLPANPENVDVPTTANYVKVLNATSGAGTTWGPSSNAGDADIYWSFVQDTTALKDGWMQMHYVVVDQADNRSYYTQYMIVMNNYPMITNVSLYTNNTGEGAVFTTHDGNEARSDYAIPSAPYAGGYLNSGFISKNNVIGFGVETVRGNDPLTYEAHYVERYLVELTKANLIAMANGTGTLAHLPNTVYLNAQGVVVSGALPGTPVATVPATTSSSGFVDLYTIANGNSGKIPGGAPVWRLLGVPVSSTPQDGTHFVFQGISVTTATDPKFNAENNVENMAGFPGVYVYAYKQMLSTGKKPPTNGKSIPLVSGEESPLTFKGVGTGGHFNGTGKINEAQALLPINPVYTASSVPGDINTASQGTAFFLIKVYDTVDGPSPAYHDEFIPGSTTETLNNDKDMLYDAVVIGMKVYVGDRRPPYARLYDLNPYTEGEVTGGNSNANFRQQTLNNAAAPYTEGNIGENIKRGGLYNVGTESAPVKSGYIDPYSGSAALNPYVNYPNDPLNPYLGSRRDRPNGWVNGDVTTGVTIDKVSGKIILRGLAWDDQLIDTISITIGGVEQTILTLRYVNKTTGVVMPSPTQTEINDGTAVRKMVAEPNVSAWAYENIHWQTGHTVEWAYLWDTEKLPNTSNRADNRGGPLTGQTITVRVRDLNSSTTPASRLTSATVTADTPTANPPNFHNQISVDIVPYVTGISRELPKFATKRSRQGWYSFFQGEGNIRILGYNLGSTTTTAITLSAAGAATGGSATDSRSYAPTTGRDAALPDDGHIFAIPAAASSSRINVSVGAEATVSNRVWNHESSHANKSWNRDNSDFVSGSDLWTNKLYAHIWRTNEDNTTPITYFGNNTGSGGSWDMESPSMALEYGTSGNTGTSGETTGNGNVPGRLHGVWGHRSTFKIYYGANDNGAGIRQQEAQDPMAFTDLAYYPGTNNANNLTEVYVYQWDALPNLLIRTHMKYLADGGGNALGLNPGGTIVPFLIMRQDRDDKTSTYRWQNVRTSMTSANANTGNDNSYAPHNENGASRDTQNAAAQRGRAGRVYTTGYDSVGHNVFFIERVGSDNYPSNAGSASRLPLFIDGGNAVAGVTNMAVTGLTGYTVTTTSARAGNWSAVDYVTNGGTNDTTTVPVVAYYDDANDTIRLAYGSVNGNGDNGANGTGARWTRRNVLASNDPLFRGSGKYVSMKVDKADNIHLAFYNSNHNAMVYAKGTRTGAFEAVIVDNVVTGGTWTDISVDDDGNPWIVYGDSGRSGNYDGVRIAYKNSGFTRALTDKVSKKSITGWEALTMPADYTITDDRLNIEAWPPTDRRATTSDLGAASPNGGWHAAVGYAGTGGTTKQFRIGYFFKPATALMGGL